MFFVSFSPTKIILDHFTTYVPINQLIRCPHVRPLASFIHALEQLKQLQNSGHSDGGGVESGTTGSLRLAVGEAVTGGEKGAATGAATGATVTGAAVTGAAVTGAAVGSARPAMLGAAVTGIAQVSGLHGAH